MSWNDFLVQTEPNKIQARLETLEFALAERLQELKASKDSQAETLAIKEACRKQSAVAMRVVARLASVKLAFLSWLGTTVWTRDRGNMLWGELFSHSRGTISQTLCRRRHVIESRGCLCFTCRCPERL